MIRIKQVLLLLVAGSLLLAGNVQAEDKAPASTTPVAKAAAPAVMTMKAAGALAAEGKTDEAIAAYEALGVMKTPKGEGWRLNNMGLAYMIATTPAPEKAVPLFEKAVSTDATNQVAWNNLGSAYEQTDALEMAKEAYTKAVEVAKAAGASSEKAEANLTTLQARMDRIQAKKDKAALKAAGKTAPAATPVAGDKK